MTKFKYQIKEFYFFVPGYVAKLLSLKKKTIPKGSLLLFPNSIFYTAREVFINMQLAWISFHCCFTKNTVFNIYQFSKLMKPPWSFLVDLQNQIMSFVNIALVYFTGHTLTKYSKNIIMHKHDMVCCFEGFLRNHWLFSHILEWAKFTVKTSLFPEY